MNYKGVIIEESLEDPNLLSLVKILRTKVEQVTDTHKTPWLKQWTLHTVEILEAEVDAVAKQMSHSLDMQHGGSWYADFKNATTHYIIFPGRVFRVDRNKSEEYDAAKQYGISLGIPEYQVDFSPEVDDA